MKPVGKKHPRTTQKHWGELPDVPLPDTLRVWNAYCSWLFVLRDLPHHVRHQLCEILTDAAEGGEPVDAAMRRQIEGILENCEDG